MKILPLHPENLASWLKFRRQWYPSFPHYGTEAFYTYRFVECPPHYRPVHRVAIENDEVVGEFFISVVHLHAGDVELNALAGADLMVDERFRKQGIWWELMSEAFGAFTCRSFIGVAAGKHTQPLYAQFGECQSLDIGAWFHLPMDLRPYFLRQGKSPTVARLHNAISQPVLWKTQLRTRLPKPALPGLLVRTAQLPADFSNRPFIGTELAGLNDVEWYRWRMQAVVGFKEQDQFVEAIREGQRIGFAICGYVQRFVRADLPQSSIGLIKECRTRPDCRIAIGPLLRACVDWLRTRPNLEGIRMFAPPSMVRDLTALGFSQRETHQAVVGGPLLALARSAPSGLCTYDDPEVRLG